MASNPLYELQVIPPIFFEAITIWFLIHALSENKNLKREQKVTKGTQRIYGY